MQQRLFPSLGRHRYPPQLAPINGLGQAVPVGASQRWRQIGPLPGCHYRQGRGTTGHHHAVLATWLGDHNRIENWSLEPVKAALPDWLYLWKATGIGTRTRPRTPGTRWMARTSPTPMQNQPWTNYLRGSDFG